MAKKIEKKASADKTTTYSTRLNEEQRAHLEEAAAVAGVSASRFIRDATLRAAADVVNATAPNDRAISSAASRLAKTLLHPHGIVTFLDERDTPTYVECIFGPGGVDIRPNLSEYEPEERRYPERVELKTLTAQDVEQLIAIAESCPLSFAIAFRESLRGVNEPSPKFEARSNPDQLLSD